MKISRKLISFLLAAVMALSPLGVNALAAGKTYFKGKISYDAGSASGIKLDVYGSVRSGGNDDYQKYDNKYLFSVKTDKNGAFSFERPSGMFVIRADMSTLPKKTGITENMWTVADKSVSSVSARVRKISAINISCGNAVSGDIDVYIMSADGKRLYCDHSVDVSDENVTEYADKTTGKRTFLIERRVTVKANGTKKTHVLTSTTTETAVPVVSLEKPEYAYPCTYTEGDGFFEIHYDKYQYEKQTVKNIYDTFTDAKKFYDGYGLKSPIKESGSRKYRVYLVTSGVASATTKHIKNGSGYIILQAPKSYRRDVHVFITSVIAHELFHAITNAYTRAYDVTPSKWFREAFANWAGMAFLGRATETPKVYVDIFQSAPELPLSHTYDSRVYGSMLFALTVSENFGGMGTVKKILEEFRNISPDDPAPETAAMNKALAKINKGWSFSKVFIRFALNNMHPSLFYSMPGSRSWNEAARSARVTKDTTLRELGSLPLSTRYYDVSAAGSGDIRVTVYDPSGKYSDIALCCVMNKNNSRRRYFTDTVRGFSTYVIKSTVNVRNTALTLGLINTSVAASNTVDLQFLRT